MASWGGKNTRKCHHVKRAHRQDAQHSSLQFCWLRYRNAARREEGRQISILSTTFVGNQKPPPQKESIHIFQRMAPMTIAAMTSVIQEIYDISGCLFAAGTLGFVWPCNVARLSPFFVNCMLFFHFRKRHRCTNLVCVSSRAMGRVS